MIPAQLSPVVEYLYPLEDWKYVVADSERIENRHLEPLIPMALVNTNITKPKVEGYCVKEAMAKVRKWLHEGLQL